MLILQLNTTAGYASAEWWHGWYNGFSIMNHEFISKLILTKVGITRSS